MRREARPDTRLVISESEGSIDGEIRHSAMPLLIRYPSNKLNQNLEQIEMQFLLMQKMYYFYSTFLPDLCSK